MADYEQKVHWEAEKYDVAMNFVSAFGASMLDVLKPQTGERILDFGCGTGDLAARIAESGAQVTGVDISPEMVERARKKYPQVRFECADGTSWRPDGKYDAVFSNAALHWMKDAEGAAATMAACLRPGGRLVAEFGGHGNVSRIMAAMKTTLDQHGRGGAFVDPWYFPTVGEYATLLEKHGFEVGHAMLFDRPTPLEEGEQGMVGWYRMFGHVLVAGATEEEATRYYKEASERLKDELYENGRWRADYRRIRIEAIKVR